MRRTVRLSSTTRIVGGEANPTLFVTSQIVEIHLAIVRRVTATPRRMRADARSSPPPPRRRVAGGDQRGVLRLGRPPVQVPDRWKLPPGRQRRVGRGRRGGRGRGCGRRWFGRG